MKKVYQILFICSFIVTTIPTLHAMERTACISGALLGLGTAAIKNKDYILFAFNFANQSIQQYFNWRGFKSVNDEINNLRANLIEKIEISRESIERNLINLETNFNGNLESTKISLLNELTEIRDILSSIQTTLNRYDEALKNIFSDTILLKNKLSSLETNFRNFRGEFSTFRHDTDERLNNLASDTTFVRNAQVEQKSDIAMLLIETKEIKLFTANNPKMETKLDNITQRQEQLQEQLNNITQMLQIFGSEILQNPRQTYSCHQSAILTKIH